MALFQKLSTASFQEISSCLTPLGGVLYTTRFTTDSGVRPKEGSDDRVNFEEEMAVAPPQRAGCALHKPPRGGRRHHRAPARHCHPARSVERERERGQLDLD